MDFKAESYNTSPETHTEEEEEESSMKEVVKRGPWTVDEDLLLMSYIANHGEGRWNSLARSAGLKRTGKSCRLRWLNYLHPDVRRGNITLEEQLTILQLHSQWGNRWSKIAQHLPGRTDNEIKNYWRTRVQKQAKQLGCSVNSQQFRDTMRYVWMPRLMERIQATSSTVTSMTSSNSNNNNNNNNSNNGTSDKKNYASPEHSIPNITAGKSCSNNNPSYISDNNSMAISSDGQQSPISGLQEYSAPPLQFQLDSGYNLSSLTAHANFSECLPSPNGCYNQNGMGCESNFDQNMWLGNDHFWDNLWNVDPDIWLPK